MELSLLVSWSVIYTKRCCGRNSSGFELFSK